MVIRLADAGHPLRCAGSCTGRSTTGRWRVHMSGRWKGSVLAAAVAATVTGATLLGSTPAAAAEVDASSLTMVSDPGDPVGLGLTYDYSVAAGDGFAAAVSADRSLAGAVVNAANGDSWTLQFAAPD